MYCIYTTMNSTNCVSYAYPIDSDDHDSTICKLNSRYLHLPSTTNTASAIVEILHILATAEDIALVRFCNVHTEPPESSPSPTVVTKMNHLQLAICDKQLHEEAPPGE